MTTKSPLRTGNTLLEQFLKISASSLSHDGSDRETEA